MIDPSEMALLPTGLQDVLPPDAAHEAATGEALLARIALSGYERVKPPLVEFEDGLLAGAGAGLADQTFRLMDPVSRRMMAVRSDVTPQVARIATSRLAKAPRPLRLSYSGDILRVQGSELRPERQFRQVGYELIGPAAVAGDAEVVLLAADALRSVGVDGLSVDLNAPTLVTAVLENLSLATEEARALRAAIDRKDEAGVRALGGVAAEPLMALFGAVGTAGPALEKLAAIELPGGARQAADALANVADLVMAGAPDLPVTVDPVEHRSFEYHTGTSFTMFAQGVRGELGRGGRYAVGAGAAAETATGCTLYLDSVLRAVPARAAAPRIFVPAGISRDTITGLQAEGWVTVVGLEVVDDPREEGLRLACTHVWIDGGTQPLDS